MFDSVYCLTKSLVFDTLLLYHYSNLTASIICSLFYGDIRIFCLVISIDFSFVYKAVSESFCYGFFVILLEILLPIKSPVDFTVF